MLKKRSETASTAVPMVVDEKPKRLLTPNLILKTLPADLIPQIFFFLNIDELSNFACSNRACSQYLREYLKALLASIKILPILDDSSPSLSYIAFQLKHISHTRYRLADAKTITTVVQYIFNMIQIHYHLPSNAKSVLFQALRRPITADFYNKKDPLTYNAINIARSLLRHQLAQPSLRKPHSLGEILPALQANKIYIIDLLGMTPDEIAALLASLSQLDNRGIQYYPDNLSIELTPNLREGPSESMRNEITSEYRVWLHPEKLDGDQIVKAILSGPLKSIFFTLTVISWLNNQDKLDGRIQNLLTLINQQHNKINLLLALCRRLMTVLFALYSNQQAIEYFLMLKASPLPLNAQQWQAILEEQQAKNIANTFDLLTFGPLFIYCDSNNQTCLRSRTNDQARIKWLTEADPPLSPESFSAILNTITLTGCAAIPFAIDRIILILKDFQDALDQNQLEALKTSLTCRIAGALNTALYAFKIENGMVVSVLNLEHISQCFRGIARLPIDFRSFIIKYLPEYISLTHLDNIKLILEKLIETLDLASADFSDQNILLISTFFSFACYTAQRKHPQNQFLLQAFPDISPLGGKIWIVLCHTSLTPRLIRVAIERILSLKKDIQPILLRPHVNDLSKILTGGSIIQANFFGCLGKLFELDPIYWRIFILNTLNYALKDHQIAKFYRALLENAKEPSLSIKLRLFMISYFYLIIIRNISSHPDHLANLDSHLEQIVSTLNLFKTQGKFADIFSEAWQALGNDLFTITFILGTPKAYTQFFPSFMENLIPENKPTSEVFASIIDVFKRLKTQFRRLTYLSDIFFKKIMGDFLTLVGFRLSQEENPSLDSKTQAIKAISEMNNDTATLTVNKDLLRLLLFNPFFEVLHLLLTDILNVNIPALWSDLLLPEITHKTIKDKPEALTTTLSRIFEILRCLPNDEYEKFISALSEREDVDHIFLLTFDLKIYFPIESLKKLFSQFSLEKTPKAFDPKKKIFKAFLKHLFDSGNLENITFFLEYLPQNALTSFRKDWSCCLIRAMRADCNNNPVHFPTTTALLNHCFNQLRFNILTTSRYGNPKESKALFSFNALTNGYDANLPKSLSAHTKNIKAFVNQYHRQLTAETHDKTAAQTLATAGQFAPQPNLPSAAPDDNDEASHVQRMEL